MNVKESAALRSSRTPQEPEGDEYAPCRVCGDPRPDHMPSECRPYVQTLKRQLVAVDKAIGFPHHNGKGRIELINELKAVLPPSADQGEAQQAGGVPQMPNDSVRRSDVVAVWNRWRKGLPDAAFAHSDGVKFLQRLAGIPTAALSGAAQQAGKDGLVEVLKRASAFDDVIGRVQMYGAADRVRESWRLLKDTLLAVAALSSPPVADSPTWQGVDYDSLDPGIREIVRKVNAAGFETSDSGDGVSKPADWYESGEAIPFPHVVAVSTPRTMVADAERMALILGAGWNVEAEYQTLTGSAHLFARTLNEQELSHAPEMG